MFAGMSIALWINAVKDVEENFTINIHGTFEVNPSSCVKLASLSWEAPTKTTTMQYELLNDANMMLFYEKGIRGGIARVISHYVKANNKCIYDYNK